MNLKTIALFLSFIAFGFTKDDPKIHFQIKKETPAFGLTLGYNLPEEQLQKIVGDKFKPAVKDGKGFLMLFICTTKKYYLGNNVYDNMKLSHILVPVVGDKFLSAPLTIVPEKQELNKPLKQYGFKPEMGKNDLQVSFKNDSVSINAYISTGKGKIELSAAFLNKPGETKTLEGSKICAVADPNSYFTGPESYRPINIESINIKSTGDNWMSKLKLPSKPDRVWLNTEFVWDFVFGKTN